MPDKERKFNLFKRQEETSAHQDAIETQQDIIFDLIQESTQGFFDALDEKGVMATTTVSREALQQSFNQIQVYDSEQELLTPGQELAKKFGDILLNENKEQEINLQIDYRDPENNPLINLWFGGLYDSIPLEIYSEIDKTTQKNFIKFLMQDSGLISNKYTEFIQSLNENTVINCQRVTLYQKLLMAYELAKVMLNALEINNNSQAET